MVGDIHLEKALSITGWMSPTELNWLANEANKHKILVEIGCLRGRSTRAIADNTEGHVYCVDPWLDIYYDNNNKPLLPIGDDIYNEFLKNMEGCTNVSVFRGDLQDFRESNLIRGADFIFIDGDHREEAVRNDIRCSLGLINTDGVICGHDYTHRDWPAVKKVVDEEFPNREIVDSIWIIRF